MLTLHYDARFGLARGAVYKDGQPHLYAEGYETDPFLALLGVRSVARLKSRAGGMNFLVLADGSEAVLDAPQGVALNEGAAVEVDIVAEARPGKLARARFIAPSTTGDPRRLSPVLNLKARLNAQSELYLGAAPVEVAVDYAALDEAYDAACAPSGPLQGGGDLSVQVTRGLIACDVDSAGGESSFVTPRAFAKACNERAVADLPRRLRLAGLGGLVVVDLIGSRHNGERLRQLLLDGFGVEASRIIVAPIGKFGTLEFVRPWGASPVNSSKPMSQAVSLIWQALRLSQEDRGRRLILRAPETILDILRPLVAASLDPLGPMLKLELASSVEVIYA